MSFISTTFRPLWLFRIGLVLFLSIGFQNQQKVQAQTENYVAHQAIVQLKHNQPVEHLLQAIWESYPSANLRVERVLSQRINIWLLQFDGFQGPDREMLRILRDRPEVEIAQFNHTNLEQRILPNDTDFSVQWNLFNDGTNGGPGMADVDAERAWDITTGGTTANGDTIVVAVIDGNFDLTHEDLDFFKNRHDSINGIDDDGNGYLDDFDGWNAYDDTNTFNGFNKSHGTHVSGIVGARGNNGLGVTGVNWNVKIMPIRGSSTQEAPVIAAYAYALEMRLKYNETNGDSGAYVVATNSSFGANYGQPANFPIWCAMYDTLGQAGIVNVGATANINIDVDVSGDIPTTCPSNYLVAVTATNSQDQKLPGVAYGPTHIDLGAPGNTIYSTDATNSFGFKTGTSMATPMVSGAIALMYSNLCAQAVSNGYQRPDSLAGMMIDALLQSGTEPVSDLSGATTTGGRLDLFKAVTAAGEILCHPISTGPDLSQASADWQVYPNPSLDGQVTVSIPPNTSARLWVSNVLGAVVWETRMVADQQVLNGSNWPSGVYFVTVQYDGAPPSTQRLVLRK
ncbi:MAG: S8 family peptidase [Salibacteraceae bacterium]